MGLFSKFDRSGRVPRHVQVIGLDFIEDKLNLESDQIQNIALQIPVGGGKTLIAKSVQEALPSWIVTASNPLIDQIAEDYPTHNVVKGLATYSCHSTLMKCDDWKAISGNTCEDCPYKIAKERAVAGDPTTFNPMSLFYNLRSLDNDKVQRPGISVFDEAHQLASMLLSISGVALKDSKYKLPEDPENILKLTPWLQTKKHQLDELVKLYIKNEKLKEVGPIRDESQRIGNVIKSLTENAQNYAIYTEKDDKDTILQIKPVRPPQWLTRKVLGNGTRIFMSGTLFKTDIEDLIGSQAYSFIDLPSPIPKENRPVYYKPAPFKVNYQTDPAQLVKEIEKILDKRPGKNTIIHVSYSMSKKMLPHFKNPVLHNTQENKAKIIEKFKAEGGVFLASGCAEGLDLKDDLCRVNIIPQLLFPNRSDKIVAKRLAMPGGELWYSLEVFKTLIQAIGRSTRNERDFSESFILDPNFGRMLESIGQMERKSKVKLLPQSFVEQIKWSNPF